MAACCIDGPGDCGAPASTPGAWLRLGIACVLAGQLMVFGLAMNISPPEGAARHVIHACLAAGAIAVFLLAGRPIAVRSWQALRAGRATTEQLFLLGITGAFAVSARASWTGQGAVYYEVVAVLVAIHTLGNLLIARRRRDAAADAQGLRAEFGEATRVGADGRLDRVPVAVLKPGDRVWIAAGAGIPVDGRVLEGRAFVRETPLTGEPFAVVRAEGERVLAGSWAEDAGLLVEAEAVLGARRLDEVLRLVDGARGRASAWQRLADRATGFFLPFVVLVAAGTLAGWWMAAGPDRAVYNALAVIVVACPCALGLATPLGVWAAMDALAWRGIAVTCGSFIERCARARTVVFDKTGTLSTGRLELAETVAAAGQTPAELAALGAAVEKSFAHPVAAAFAPWTGGGAAREVRTIPGVGVEGKVAVAGKERHVRVGNSRLSAEAGGEEGRALVARASAPGPARDLFIEVDKCLAGMFRLREEFHPAAAELPARLAAAGLDVEVLSGDPEAGRLAMRPARVTGGLSARAKADRIAAREAAGERVLFVGDGVNDAAAMGAASASVAVGGGAALAEASAQALIRPGALGALPEAIEVCRGVERVLRGNLVFALVYNTCGMGLAASGHLHPVAASLLMLAASATVTIRALGWSPRFRETLDAGGRPAPAPIPVSSAAPA